MPGVKFVVTMALSLGIELSYFSQKSSYTNNEHFGVWPKHNW